MTAMQLLPAPTSPVPFPVRATWVTQAAVCHARTTTNVFWARTSAVRSPAAIIHSVLSYAAAMRGTLGMVSTVPTSTSVHCNPTIAIPTPPAPTQPGLLPALAI